MDPQRHYFIFYVVGGRYTIVNVQPETADSPNFRVDLSFPDGAPGLFDRDSGFSPVVFRGF